jgi:hypothetical protein
MKRLLLCVLFAIFIPAHVFAAGSVTQTGLTRLADTSGWGTPSETYTITFTCTGDASDGTIPNTDTNAANTALIKGLYLYQVIAYPTSGGTAPDAADVMIYDANGMDLLGSVDGGTTPYAGANLIHATLSQTCFPSMYLVKTTSHVNYFPIVTGALTLDVDNQGTNSANWTIVLVFVK